MLFSNKWKGWFLRRCLEVFIYTFVTLVSEHFSRINGLSFSLLFNDIKILIALLATYGFVLLYIPISGLVFFVAKKFGLTSINYEAIWFLIHSFCALSLMYNQIFGVSKTIDYSSHLLLGWYIVLLLHVFLMVTFALLSRRNT